MRVVGSTPEPDAVLEFLDAGAPHEPIEEARLTAELQARLFGEPNRAVLLARYVVLERLATGGTAAVYRAYDPELDRRVAIKLLRLARRGSDAQERQGRLLAEAQALARLSHPNVVTVYDVGTYDAGQLRGLSASEDVDGGGVFLVLELVEGYTLAQWLRATPRRRAPEIIDVFVAAGRGLAAAHARGLCHLDFKPDNVLLDAGGRPRVSDFGLAQARHMSEVDDVANPGAGTPAYMAPEQHRGEIPDERADQFAFCCSLLEALTAAPVFPGPTCEEFARQKLRGPATSRPAGCPSWLFGLLRRGLAPHREERFATLDELLTALDRGRLRRRSRLVWGGSAAILGALALGVPALLPDPPRACTTQDPVAAAWSDPARAEIAAAFAGTGRPFAAAAATHVLGRLDRWAAQWSASRASLCAETPSATPALAVQQLARLACLDRRALRLEEFLGVLRHADARVVELSGEAVDTLPTPAACLAMPGDGAGGTSGETHSDATFERDLARAEALRDGGRYTEASIPATAALARARDAADIAGRLRAGKVLASVQVALAAHVEAESTLDEALRLAEERGLEDAAIESLVDLASVLGLGLARQPEAARLATLAQARLARRDASDELDFRAALVTAKLHRTAGRHREAQDEIDRALVLATRLFDPADLRIADVLNEAGNVLDVEGDHGTALDRYAAALEIRRAALGPDHPRVAETLNNLANVQRNLGRLPEALESYGAALAIDRASLGDAHPATADILNNLAILEQDLGRPESAIEHHRTALEIRRGALGPDHPLVAQSMDNLGVQLHALGHHDEALQLHVAALALRRRILGPGHPDVALSANNAGVVLASLGRWTEALTQYEAALTLREATLAAGHPHLVTSLISVASALAALDRRAEARTLLARALRLQQARLGADHPDVAQTAAQLAALENAGR